MIEAFYPDATKIELFARNYRHGWESVGNQLNQSILDEVEK
jgi:N6-adenosine-specific RNA methylase IME4